MLRTGRSDAVRAVIEDPESDLHVPALCDVEVSAGIRRALLAGVMHEHRAVDAVHDYLDLPLTTHGHRALIERILALRTNFSAYDAAYVALAERIEAVLLTADQRLVRAVRTHLPLAVLDRG